MHKVSDIGLPAAPRLRSYESKLDLLGRYVEGRSVVHLGAVGETCGSVEARVAAAPSSVHAYITRLAGTSVGIDTAVDAVAALVDNGIFDNLLCADATMLARTDIPLDRIDVIVAGDIIEHLSSPGLLLDAAHRLSDADTVLVVTTPNSFGAARMLAYLRGTNVEGDDHKVSFNIWSLSNLLLAHGWSPIFAATCYQPAAEAIHGGAAFKLGRAVFRRFPKLGGTLLVSAQRQTAS